MLSKDERLEYCKFCENGHKTESGEWLCRLTMQEPSFDSICYDYKETQARTRLRRINEETDIAINNEGVDYTQLNWDDLEPEKEIPFCPDKKEIVQGQYVEKEIVAVPINDVRWWVIDKVPDIDLSEHLKIIVRNSYWHMHFRHWSFLGAVSSPLLILF
ncbi:hypothetical protein [Ancylomarina sp. 16SWW S1-10-2]|uniref:hypothetical protein n=1 Tax=Ancylomarina sp. 16SWW S1-10-2 TaxID=2499681 RepID=UPI0012ADE49A|nr:hypothetical protein [Ancylomarina sp. 16SWW S1-10-2]MRT94762.1 hypothetical protein [Ancylomarina sp. 16SWW S1-10-2]